MTKKYGFVHLRYAPRHNKEYGMFYISPNDMVLTSTYYRGKDKSCQVKADIRRHLLGHNYNVKKNAALVEAINTAFYVSDRWFLDNFRKRNREKNM